MIDQQQIDNFLRLKSELALRDNNEHVGSGAGGNASQLFFLMSNRVDIKTGAKFHFDIDNKDRISVFSPKEKVSSAEMRKVFDEFYQAIPNKVEVTQEQLSSLSFLSDITNPTSDIKLLIKAISLATNVRNWLDSKQSLNSKINVSFNEETRSVHNQLLLELGLPLNYFDKQEGNLSAAKLDYDPLSKMLIEHPVYAPKLRAIKARHKVMSDALLSQDELDGLITVGTMPVYITLFVMRSIITVEQIIRFDLDERVGSIFARVSDFLESK